jgi:hypothetical protein
MYYLYPSTTEIIFPHLQQIKTRAQIMSHFQKGSHHIFHLLQSHFADDSAFTWLQDNILVDDTNVKIMDAAVINSTHVVAVIQYSDVAAADLLVRQLQPAMVCPFGIAVQEYIYSCVYLYTAKKEWIWRDVSLLANDANSIVESILLEIGLN